MFNYTLHWTKGDLARRIGSCALLRRQKKGHSILVHLMMNFKILQVGSEGLSELLRFEGISCRKTTTKAGKIRQLMKLGKVQEACDEQHVLRLETLLAELESRRNKKNQTSNDDAAEEEAFEEATVPTLIIKVSSNCFLFVFFKNNK